MDHPTAARRRFLQHVRRQRRTTTTPPARPRCTGAASSSPGTTSSAARRPAPTTNTSPPTSGPSPPPSHDWPTCADLGWVRSDAPPGHPQFGRLHPCECQRASLAQRRMDRLLQISGLLEPELALTLDDVKAVGGDTAVMERAARAFLREPFGFLTLWGGVGNGKTLILQVVVNELRENHAMEGVYITFKDLIDFVRAGFDHPDFPERERYDYLRDVPVLAIDEIDKARMTAYSEEFRTAFFDYRYRLAWTGTAVILFAMNCRPRELPPHIYDRLRDVLVLAIDGIDKARMTAYADEFRTAFFDYRYRLAWTGTAVTLFATNCRPRELPPHIYDRLRDGRFHIISNHDDSMRPTMETAPCP